MKKTCTGFKHQPVINAAGFQTCRECRRFHDVCLKEGARRLEELEADQPAPTETAPKPQCDGSCGSLFCGAIYGREVETVPPVTHTCDDNVPPSYCDACLLMGEPTR